MRRQADAQEDELTARMEAEWNLQEEDAAATRGGGGATAEDAETLEALSRSGIVYRYTWLLTSASRCPGNHIADADQQEKEDSAG